MDSLDIDRGYKDFEAEIPCHSSRGQCTFVVSVLVETADLDAHIDDDKRRFNLRVDDG